MVIPSVGSLILKRDFVRREEIKASFFPKEDVWLGEKETGWVAVPRTFPLILNLIGSKALSGNKNPSLVYLELLSRLRGDGIIKMERESDHAYAAGYVGPRAVRTWQERMQTLAKLGFIRIQRVGNERYKYVALIHPRRQCKSYEIARVSRKNGGLRIYRERW